VFLALFHHLRAGKPRTNLKAWVFRVGHNLALKQRIRNGKLGRLCQSGEEAAMDRPGREPNPEEHLAGTQYRAKLLKIVEFAGDRTLLPVSPGRGTALSSDR
jgi:RNA polymerase sigma-70 factor (ECF subfamily)